MKLITDIDKKSKYLTVHYYPALGEIVINGWINNNKEHKDFQVGETIKL